MSIFHSFISLAFVESLDTSPALHNNINSIRNRTFDCRKIQPTTFNPVLQLHHTVSIKPALPPLCG